MTTAARVPRRSPRRGAAQHGVVGGSIDACSTTPASSTSFIRARKPAWPCAEVANC